MTALSAFLRGVAFDPFADWYACDRLIFADWLDEHGDERGTVLRQVQVVNQYTIEQCGSLAPIRSLTFSGTERATDLILESRRNGGKWVVVIRTFSGGAGHPSTYDFYSGFFGFDDLRLFTASRGKVDVQLVYGNPRLSRLNVVLDYSTCELRCRRHILSLFPEVLITREWRIPRDVWDATPGRSSYRFATGAVPGHEVAVVEGMLFGPEVVLRQVVPAPELLAEESTPLVEDERGFPQPMSIAGYPVDWIEP